MDKKNLGTFFKEFTAKFWIFFAKVLGRWMFGRWMFINSSTWKLHCDINKLFLAPSFYEFFMDCNFNEGSWNKKIQTIIYKSEKNVLWNECANKRNKKYFPTWTWQKTVDPGRLKVFFCLLMEIWIVEFQKFLIKILVSRSEKLRQSKPK